MKMALLYDKVAQTYNQGPSSTILSQSNNHALQLTRKHFTHIQSLLSLGIGDGAYLAEYINSFPDARIHGLDISENMLQKARASFQCDISRGDARHAAALIGNKQFELIHAHFLLAYVSLPDILQQCNSLLVPQGMISIVSNTQGSFAKLKAKLPLLELSRNPFNKYIARHVRETLANIHVPNDIDHLSQLLAKQEYTLHDAELITLPVNLHTGNDMFDFFIDGGWFVSGLDHPLISDDMIRRIVKRLISKYVNLPYQDTLEVVVALAKKKNDKK